MRRKDEILRLKNSFEIFSLRMTWRGFYIPMEVEDKMSHMRESTPSCHVEQAKRAETSLFPLGKCHQGWQLPRHVSLQLLTSEFLFQLNYPSKRFRTAALKTCFKRWRKSCWIFCWFRICFEYPNCTKCFTSSTFSLYWDSSTSIFASKNFRSEWQYGGKVAILQW